MADMTVWEKLAAPFPAQCIHWRIGATTQDKSKGIPLAYLDARDIMDRLDQVIGPEGWSDKYEETATGTVVCTLALAVQVGGNRHVISKSDGAGKTDVESDKGGLSDAFKRAAVKFGIGRYLYRLGNVWVPIKQAGKSYVLAGAPPTLPDWALPGGPPPPSAYTEFPIEEGSFPTKEEPSNVVPLDNASKHMTMLRQFEELQTKGIKKMGLGAYVERVNMILDTGYGGASWKDDGIDLEVCRKMYKDINAMIDNYAGGAA
jgi:hypothetical protein